MPVRLVVDNRVRVVGKIPDDASEKLREEFEHDNPDFWKKKRFNLRGHFPRKAPTWTSVGGELSFPRGGFDRVRDALNTAGVSWEIDDQRLSVPAEIPPHRVEPWPFQRDVVERARLHQSGILRSPAGCLVGDTVIGTNRATLGRPMKLAHVVRMYNGGSASGRTWDTRIETRVRAPHQDGAVRLSRVLGATASGVRPVYELKLECGLRVEGTADHRVMTPFGWVAIGDLVPGADYVMFDDTRGRRPIKRVLKKSKPSYLMRHCPGHPQAVARGKGCFSVVLHRLVVEAQMNGLPLEEFIKRVRAGARGLRFLSPDLVVHHDDRDTRNNELSNLIVMTEAEHKQVHAADCTRNFQARLAPSRVVSVEYSGEKETYDLEVEDAGAFMANGIAVHNSGKSTALLRLISQLGQRTLVVVWAGGLLRQWVRRVAKELGVPESWVGVVDGKTKRLGPITIGMQRTLLNRVDEYAGEFGLVAADEVHRAAADGLYRLVDAMPAKYRIGVSDDERRRDRKEFLIYDLFGPVVADVDHKMLVDEGYILDVDVRVVPTEFDAPWYRDIDARHDAIDGDDEQAQKARARLKREKGERFDELLAAMLADERRNALIARLAVDEKRAGEQVILMSHRIDHVRMYDRLLGELGLRCGFVIGGEENRVEYESTVARLAAGRLDAAVGTYQAIGTGIDLPKVAAGILTTPIANSQDGRSQFKQFRGRFARTADGKDGARLYYPWDVRVYGARPLENLCRWSRRVVVWWHDAWTPGRAVLKEMS